LCDLKHKNTTDIDIGLKYSIMTNPSNVQKLDDKDLADKFNLIPEGTDILITHCPPWGILDENTENFNCGSHALRMAVEFVKPKIHVFSHIHENGGRDMMLKHAGPNTLCINCSVMDERYIHTHKIMNIKI